LKKRDNPDKLKKLRSLFVVIECIGQYRQQKEKEMENALFSLIPLVWV